MSNGNFGACFNFTIGEEGKYQCRRTDNGNWSGGRVGVGRLIGTCWGISAPLLIEWVGPDSAASVTPAYMQALSIDTARDIYYSKFWLKVAGDDLPAGVDLAVWDFGVNAGTYESVELLQRIVGVDQDGDLGPHTLDAVKSRQAADLIAELIEAHDDFYRSLPEFSEDGAGWLSRQQHLKIVSLSMAAPIPIPTAE